MARLITLAALTGTVALSGCAQTNPQLAAKHNPTVYSVHQPIVQRTDYVLDLASAGSLSPVEQGRLRGWFDGLQLGYGDRVSIDGGGSYVDARVRQDISEVTQSYGLLLSDGAPVTAGAVQPGITRVVVSRMSASVPGCPDWSYAALTGSAISTDSNYGCAINSNLAAMIADPADLVLGQTGSTAGDAAAASRAVKAYRDRPQSGAAGNVKPESPGGK